MKKKRVILLLALLLLLPFILYTPVSVRAQEGQAARKDSTGKDKHKERVYTNKTENNVCLKCHSKTHIEYMAEGATKVYKQKMFSECIIDTNLFYNANHWNFKCTDCHSDEYSTFPHKGELRFEEKPGCLDCHAGDPQYAQFNFEKIDEEFKKSIHFQRQGGSFSCWACHDGHYYKINARNRQENILAAIEYDNNICLSCHANIQKYQLITNKVNPNILQKHEWLPNQPNHFKHVRCIECHAQVNDSLMVAHNIQPKSKAVKKCAECHSGNSRLMASLYKYQLENQGKYSLPESGFTNEPVIIGGKRNGLLKLLGNIALLLTIVVVVIHSTLRIVSKKN
ncbi:MAG: cytochrome c3 family protein [Bacteroidetes bacterium]|nr:cytochrome c3 family protein [Bacteroidota bacterium]